MNREPTETVSRPAVPPPIGGTAKRTAVRQPSRKQQNPGRLNPELLQKINQNNANRTGRGTSQTAQKKHCPKCHTQILAGLDAHRAALDVNIDPTPLTRRQQLTYLIHGIRQYDISPTGLINHRTPQDINHAPPQPGHTRHARHTCQQPVPNQQPQNTNTTVTITDDEQGPPF